MKKVLTQEIFDQISWELEQSGFKPTPRMVKQEFWKRETPFETDTQRETRKPNDDK